MALSGAVAGAGGDPESIETEATLHLNKVDAGFAIERVDLVTRAKVPGMSEEDFKQAAEQAKETCPVSQLFKGSAEITVDATLES